MPRKAPASTFVDDNLMVPLDKLRPHPTIRVREPNPEAVKAKERSIRQIGLIEPLVATAAEDGMYDVFAGQTRLAALHRIPDWKKRAVPVRVLPVDEATNFAQAMAENIEHRPLTALQECDAFQQLVLQGKSEAEIGTIFGMKPRTVGQRLQLARLIPTFRDWATKGWITIGMAGRLAARPAAEQEALIATIYAKSENAWGANKGKITDWMVEQSLEAGVIDAKHALFDVAQSDVGFVRDLFAEEGSPGVITNKARFIELQREALQARLPELAAAIDAAECIVIDASSGDNRQDSSLGTWITSKPLPELLVRPQDDEDSDAFTDGEEEFDDAGHDMGGGDEDDEPPAVASERDQQDAEFKRKRLAEEDARYDRLLIATINGDGRVTWAQRGRLKKEIAEAENQQASQARTKGTTSDMSQTQKAAVAEVQCLMAASHLMTDPLLAVRMAIVMLAAHGSKEAYDRSLGNIVAKHNSPAAEYVRDGWVKLAELGRAEDYDPTDKGDNNTLHNKIRERALMTALQAMSLDEMLPHLQAAVVQALSPEGGYASKNRVNTIRDLVGRDADGRHYIMDEYELAKFKSGDLEAAIAATPDMDAKPGKTRKATIAAIVARGTALHAEHGHAPIFSIFKGRDPSPEPGSRLAAADEEEEEDNLDEPEVDEESVAENLPDEDDDPGAAFRVAAAAE